MGFKNEGKKALGKVCLGFCQTQNVKKENSLKQLMNPSWTLPTSPGRVQAWIFV